MYKVKTRLISFILGITAAIMCIFSPSYQYAPIAEASSRMTWYLSAADAVPGDYVTINVIATNSVALKKVTNIGVVADSPIEAYGMSERCNAYNADISSSINGNKITFNMSGNNPSAQSGTLFSFYFHVPNNCPTGTYNYYFYYYHYDNHDYCRTDINDVNNPSVKNELHLRRTA